MRKTIGRGKKFFTLTIVLLTVIPAGICWGIGYTVFTRDFVVPQWLEITGLGGSVIMVKNPGETPVYPSTFRTVVCRPETFSIYSSTAANRMEVWEDSAGSATADDILNACGPLWNYSNPSSN